MSPSGTPAREETRERGNAGSFPRHPLSREAPKSEDTYLYVLVAGLPVGNHQSAREGVGAGSFPRSRALSTTTRERASRGTNTVDRCPCAGATITPIRENIVSYCRWSSDDFLSDVYAYEDAEGWALHVADRHPAIDLDKLGSVPAPDDIDAYLDRHRKLKDLLRGATLQPIEHPEAGKSYVFDCPGDLADKLDQLSRDGLHVPTGVVDALREEQAEITAKTIRRTS